MIYESEHISPLYSAFINNHMFVDIMRNGVIECAEVDVISLVLMLVEDIQRTNKQLSVLSGILRVSSAETSDSIYVIQRKGEMESHIERNRDMVISILTKCSDDEKFDISSSLKDFADSSSWVEDYNLLEMVALGGKPAGVVKLEEQYSEGLSGSEAA